MLLSNLADPLLVSTGAKYLSHKVFIKYAASHGSREILIPNLSSCSTFFFGGILFYSLRLKI
uniref:Uncharacterized protein n=1 Tax=Arundo donax TaxID=35708 RepID=A0A0A9HDG5_ARUDO